MGVNATQTTTITTTTTAPPSTVSGVKKSETSASNTDKPIYTQPAQPQQSGGGCNLGGFISNLFSSILSSILQVATASIGGPIVSAVAGLFGMKSDKKA
jgi:hypothetical protein